MHSFCVLNIESGLNVFYYIDLNRFRSMKHLTILTCSRAVQLQHILNPDHEPIFFINAPAFIYLFFYLFSSFEYSLNEISIIQLNFGK